MSHPAACPNHGPVFEVEDIGCPYCDAIRKAYQRGRDDAAEAVGIVSRGLMQSVGEGISWQHMAAIAVKAARGDLSPHE